MSPDGYIVATKLHQTLHILNTTSQEHVARLQCMAHALNVVCAGPCHSSTFLTSLSSSAVSCGGLTGGARNLSQVGTNLLL